MLLLYISPEVLAHPRIVYYEILYININHIITPHHSINHTPPNSNPYILNLLLVYPYFINHITIVNNHELNKGSSRAFYAEIRFYGLKRIICSIKFINSGQLLGFIFEILDFTPQPSV